MTGIEKEYYKRLAIQEEYGGANRYGNKPILCPPLRSGHI